MEIRKISVEKLLPAAYNPRKDLRHRPLRGERRQRGIQFFKLCMGAGMRPPRAMKSRLE